jgi:sigma-E factor negative regulatory protein RseA
MGVDSKNYERLSAFLDGDPECGAEAFAGRLVRDRELSAGWQRYHLIGDCLRGEGTLVDSRFTASLLARIAEEPTILAPSAGRKPAPQGARGTRWAAGAAVAASVAAVVVLGVVQLETTTGLVQHEARVPSSSRVAAQPADEKTRPVVQQAEVASKLNRYLANHSDFAARGALNGMTPLATFVSYGE